MGVPKQFVYRGRIRISRDDMHLLKAGRKTCTVRMGTASVAGSEISVTDGRESVPVRITRIDNQKRFGQLDDHEAQAEGFTTREELIKDLRKYYPKASDEDVVTVIYFERASVPKMLF